MRFHLRALVGLALLAALVTPAAANGRAPTTFKLVFRPGSTTEMVLGTTFGFLVSKDNGATWRWGCDSVVGIMGTYDPDYELTSTGLMLATSYTGIYMSRDGCTWTKPAGPLSDGTTSSIAVGSNGDIWATLSDPVGGYKVFKSVDDGASFVESKGVPRSDWWTSIEVAPSDPRRVYLTGFRFEGDNPRSRVLARSLNGGDSWEELSTAPFVGTNYSDLVIAGIHPTDPDTVYIRMTLTAATPQERIYRTRNGAAPLPTGPTWTQVLEADDTLSGLAIRANGDVYVVQTMLQKLHRSVDRGDTFQVVEGADYQSPCIAERPDDQLLFLCMNNQLTGSGPLTNLATSTTGAAGSWTSVLRFVDILGPVACAPGTLQYDDCQLNLWCGQKQQLGATTEEIDCSVPVDAGVVGPPPADKGCCSVGGRPGLELGAIVGLLLLRRRRRARVVS